MSKKRIVVAISGASGTIYAINLLKKLKEYPDIETHVVMSDWAHENLKLELDMSHDEFASLCDVLYPNKDLGAKIASGSFLTDGMVIASFYENCCRYHLRFFRQSYWSRS